MKFNHQKYTPVWAWIPFLFSVLSYMIVYMALLNVVIDTPKSSYFYMAGGFLVLGYVLEKYIGEVMNKDSMILKVISWIVVIIYGGFTVMFVLNIFVHSLILTFSGALALAGMIGMTLLLVEQIINNQ